MTLWIALSGLFGLIIGSFANVFVLRYGTGRSLSGRSGCAVCGKQLAWYELVPVVSYAMQRGRCRGCGSSISIQYPLVELVFGGVFALCAYVALPQSYILLVYLWVVSFLLISIAVYDIKHFIIPNGMVYVLGCVALVFNVFQPAFTVQSALFIFAAGIVVASPLFILWLLSGGKWMGFGDVKLAVAMGWMLGTIGGLSAFVFGVWIGAAVSLAVIGITRLVSRRSGLTMKSMIPFGPFLVLGTFIVLLGGITLELLLYV